MPTEEEKMLAGELYAAFDPALLAARARAKRLLHRLNVTEYVLTDAARAILAELLPHAGENLWVEPPFHCDYGTNIYCGDKAYFNASCVVLDAAPVRIGAKCCWGPACSSTPPRTP